MSRWILVTEQDGRRTRRPLADREQVVGSSAEADVLLDHPTVSRRHAALRPKPEGVEVRDLGSSNGTFVDGARLDDARIVSAETPVYFGSLAGSFEAVAEDETEAAIEWTTAGSTSPSGPAARPDTADGSPQTFSVGSARDFVAEALPRVVASLEAQRRADDGATAAQETLQTAGRELFRAFPFRALEMLREDGAEPAVLFRASAGDAPADDPAWIELRSAPLTTRVLFAPELHTRGLEPLVELVTRLAALALPPSSDAPAPPTRPAPPALPTPATVDPAMLRLYAEAARIARGEVSVLISGETGTGKEVLARYVHDASPRASKPWVAINCAALPEDLLEAELFGIEKGVATGVEARAGKFEQADGGTLFLDEIGDMALSTQAKILRVLQEGEVYRIGARAARPARARILAATNQDVPTMIERGEFRLDLFHRIADCRLRVPPLRERLGDLPSLAAHFLTRAAAESGVRARGISRAALEALTAFAWPGNVRQLEREMTRAALFLEHDELLQTRHLHGEIAGAPRLDPAAESGTLKERLDAVERRIFVDALRRHDGNVRAVARELGIGRTTVYRRLGELGIET